MPQKIVSQKNQKKSKQTKYSEFGKASEIIDKLLGTFNDTFGSGKKSCLPNFGLTCC
jgi:hypothetical protein